VSFLLSFVFLALSVLLISAIVPGIHVRNFKSALAVAAVYGLLNFLLFKVFIIVTFPLVILKVVTLGLFGIVLNAALLKLTDKLLDGFEVKGFGPALLGGVGISLMNLLLGYLF